MKKRKTMLSWSTGKDSAWTLHIMQNQPGIELTGLYCTVNEKFGRAAMHAVRTELLEKQAESTGLPLDIIPIPYPCSNTDYESIMGDFVARVKNRGVENFAFGDLYLEDIRDYRVDKLKGTGIAPVFPLWQKPTDRLALEMIDGGLKAVVTCIDPGKLPREFAGRIYNREFLKDLPPGVDPCGENGEFHTFVFAGPMFNKEIPFTPGEVVERDGFVFADVLPQTS